ncbi:MAG: beta-phosphoglucomutase, partial [Spirochaetes bacterium]|nr:beta-phosphoglucomutase [Spirochaetota bacterium]
ALFDLDGVLVDTARYHFIAWKMIASKLGVSFTKEDNEQLKGVNRIDSLNYILKMGNMQINENEKKQLLKEKNQKYIDMIEDINEKQLLAGAKDYIYKLKREGVKIALGSASKNAKMILKGLNIYKLFDAIIDGTVVAKAKPHPEVFLRGAAALGINPRECVVFEDSIAGVDAALAGEMFVVGIGNKKILDKATLVVNALSELLSN